MTSYKAETLVILSNQFPSRGGDTSFIGNEIEILAASFERVFIFSMRPLSNPDAMPSNVLYVDNLPGSGGLRELLNAIKPRDFVPLGRMIVKEIRARRKALKLPRLFRAAVTAVAGSRQIDEWANSLPEIGNVVLYSFWAADCGYVFAKPPLNGATRVIRFHGYDLYEDRAKYLPFRELILKNSDLLAPISDDGARYLGARYAGWVSDKPIEVHRLGTQDYGRGPGEPSAPLIRIVSCSSMIPLKRLDLILDVVTALQMDRSVEWVHFGDGPLRGEIERLVASSSRPGVSVVLRGQTTNREIMDYYAKTPVDAFVNLSTSEGVPVSIMEAMSFGIPVLASNVGGTGEIVSPDLGSGELVRADASIDTISATLAKIITSRSSYHPRMVWDRLCSSETNTRAFVEGIKHQRSEIARAGMPAESPILGEVQSESSPDL